MRPYAQLIKPENVLFARAEIVDGKERYTHVRIREVETYLDGYQEAYKLIIKVWTPGHVQKFVWKEDKRRKNKGEWVLEDEWDTGLGYVPMVTFYTDREDICLGRPPLQDLANLNITHWQSSSDQRTTLSVSRFPILACSGAGLDENGEGTNFTIGPFKLLSTRAENGKYYYVEHNGGALEAGFKDLDTLDKQMADYGAEFLKSRPGDQTATEKALDAAESKAYLSAMAGEFEDAVAKVLDILADWYGLGENGGTVDVVKDYGTDELQQSSMDALTKARERKDISRTTLLTVLKRMKLLPEDFSFEVNDEELSNEMDFLLGSGNAGIEETEEE